MNRNLQQKNVPAILPINQEGGRLSKQPRMSKKIKSTITRPILVQDLAADEEADFIVQETPKAVQPQSVECQMRPPMKHLHYKSALQVIEHDSSLK